MSKIVVGMSGGVDSAVAAMLLRDAGHEVTGVMLRTWDSAPSRCCEIDKAADTAKTLGIPFQVINCSNEFKKKVELPFVESYLRGETPNPCVLCNRVIKWEYLMYAKKLFSADLVATGHYVNAVRKENGRYTVRCADDRSKDQSYMLCRLTQEQLECTVFPLGGLTKPEVRAMAERADLPSAGSPDSQEICFVSEGSYVDFIAAHTDRDVRAGGNFVDEDGNVLGRHKGIVNYTVGQRRGLGLAMGHHVYVKRIDPEKNEVVICDEDALYKKEISCGDVNFLSVEGIAPGESLRAGVKIRYRHAAAPAALTAREDGTVSVVFDEAVKAPTPGQTAVFYDGEDCVIGGGFILA